MSSENFKTVFVQYNTRIVPIVKPLILYMAPVTMCTTCCTLDQNNIPPTTILLFLFFSKWRVIL